MLFPLVRPLQMYFSMTRQQKRSIYRQVGEHTMRSFFSKLEGKLPRKHRRLMGRVYGNAAFRHSEGLMGKHHSYQQFTPHPAMVQFVAREGKKLIEHG